ncbi:MAG: F0F1 ATP synthase subunit A [Planctomycetota bacterium]
MSGPGGSDKVDVIGHIIDGNILEYFSFFTGNVEKLHLPQFRNFDLSIGHSTITIPLKLFSITRHVVFMWVAAFLLILIFVLLYPKRSLIPRGFQALFEPILLFLRDEIVRPVMGKEGDEFLPYLWTLFMFIWACNLLGLVPMGATATANISVTASLAFCTFCMIHGSGIKKFGFVAYAKSIVPPVPWFVLPLMIVVEVMGLLVKPIALTIRLAANMVAGHAVLLSIMGFIFIFKSWFLSIGVVFAAMAICLLELIVAVVQAYIFTFLSTVFIGMAINPEH